MYKFGWAFQEWYIFPNIHIYILNKQEKNIEERKRNISFKSQILFLCVNFDWQLKNEKKILFYTNLKSSTQDIFIFVITKMKWQIILLRIT